MMSPGNRLAHIAWQACALFLLSLGALAQMQQPSVRAQLGAASISIEESVRLAIVATNIDGELDAAALDADFDVIGRSSSRSVEDINGVRQTSVTWVLELKPRAAGIFTIPAVTVDGIPSDLLTLTVTDAPTGNARDVFVEAELDSERPWVQSQVILTQRVFSGIDIVEGSLGPPSGEDLEVRQLGEDRQYVAERDGREYRVTERRYALFPQRSGVLSVEPIVLSVLVPAEPSRVRGFFSPTRRIERRTAALTLDVQARPDGSSGWWLPASRVELSERQASADGSGAGAAVSTEVRVGEPLTRSVVLSASGVLENQLPVIDAPEVEGLSIYADEPVRLSQVTADGIDASQSLSFAIIPERAGEFELPPVRVGWFDAASGEERTAELPSRRLTVLPAAAGGAASAPADTNAETLAGLGNSPTPDQSALRRDGDNALLPPETAGDEAATGNGSAADVAALPAGTAETVREQAEAAAGSLTLWRLLALLAFLGWAGTALAWLLARHRPPFLRKPVDDAVRDSTRRQRAADLRLARQTLSSAVRDGSAATLARAVLARAALQWPQASPKSLGTLSRRLGPDTVVQARLARLDAVLYGATGAQNQRDLSAFDELPELLEQALANVGADAAQHRPLGSGGTDVAAPGQLPNL